MHTFRFTVWLSALPVCAVLATLAGCGTGGPELPPRAKVHGKVTLDGKALTSGFVTFVPDRSRGTSGPIGVGGIDAEGHYELTTDRQSNGDGALIGFHRVRIVARAPSQDAMQSSSMTPSLIPPRYENEETSGFAFEVKADQDNEFNLPLTSK